MSRAQLTLRELRTDVLGFTQERFAGILGVSRRTLIRYEQRGAPKPILKLAGRIAQDKPKKEKS